MKQMPYGKIFQKNLVNDSGQKHRGEHKCLRFDQKPQRKDDIGRVHFAPYEAEAHVDNGQGIYGIHLSPYGGIQNDGRVKKVGCTQEKSLIF